MTWQTPIAWFGLAAIAVPIVVHLLAHRRAERMPFPTLRFLQPTRLAAIRRRALDDLALLVVRSAIVVAAVAAFAGPLLVTPARRELWDARLVRATVVAQDFSSAERLAKAVSPAIAALPPSRTGASASLAVARSTTQPSGGGKGCATPDCRPESVFRAQSFETTALPEGIHRAVTWLESAPPARRELLIAAPLTIGSLSAADLSAIPSDVGIRFTRIGDLPGTRTIQAPTVLTPSGAVQRTITVVGNETRVREDRNDVCASWPIEIVAPADLTRTAYAAMAAVLSLRVRVPSADHRARLVLVDAAAVAAIGDAAPIRTPWMADALARIARNADLREESARVANGLSDARVAQHPWHMLARALDGRPVASAAAAGERLLVVAAARDGDLLVPTLLRAIATNLAPPSDLTAAEVVAIPDSQLRAWTRQPGPPPPRRPEAVERDDRRWLWGSVLLLLLVETWMRRSTAATQHAIEETRARVA